MAPGKACFRGWKTLRSYQTLQHLVWEGFRGKWKLPNSFGRTKATSLQSKGFQTNKNCRSSPTSKQVPQLRVSLTLGHIWMFAHLSRPLSSLPAPPMGLVSTSPRKQVLAARTLFRIFSTNIQAPNLSVELGWGNIASSSCLVKIRTNKFISPA